MQCWKYTFKKNEKHYVLEIHEDGYMQLTQGEENVILFNWLEKDFDSVVSTVRSALRDFKKETQKLKKKSRVKTASV